MAQALSKKKSPAKRIHYICPTVWAWGKGRIPKMERSLDHLLTILPFEPSLFHKDKLDALYVGHRYTFTPSGKANAENRPTRLVACSNVSTRGISSFSPLPP